MPELPEIHNFARTVTAQSHRTFNRIVQSNSSLPKWPEISATVPGHGYKLAALARGKELQITITPVGGAPPVTFVFNHGLEGRWTWLPDASSLPRTMLEFHSDGGVLCLVDNMRMATWRQGTFDPKTRGPDPLTDLAAFIAGVRAGAQGKNFAKPIGEVLLNQQYFNGVGNYLRAEILARAGVSHQLTANQLFGNPQYKEKGDLVLALCHAIPQEVLDLGLNKYGSPEEKKKFQAWLTCYGKANSEKDKGGRTIWFLPNQASIQPSAKDLGYARTLLANNNNTNASTAFGSSSVPKPSASAAPSFSFGAKSLFAGAPMSAPAPARVSSTFPMPAGPVRQAAGGSYPAMTKLLTLIALLSREDKIDGDEKSQLKELVISPAANRRWRTQLEACLEYFEAENDLDEVGETLRVLTRHVRRQSGRA